MNVLAAISGDPAMMQLAAQTAELDMKRLEFDYGEFQNDKLSQMSKKFFFDADGNYDPPKGAAAQYEALAAMGATQTEMDAILGRLPEVEEAGESKNWVDASGNRISSPTSPGPEWQEAGLAEGAKNPDASVLASELDLGTKGNQAFFLRNLVEKIATMPPGAAKEKAKKDVELFRLAFSMENPDDMSIAQQYSMFESIYKPDRYWQIRDEGGDKINTPTTKEIEAAFKKFQREVVPTLGSSSGVTQGTKSFSSEGEIEAALESGDIKYGDTIILNGNEFTLNK